MRGRTGVALACLLLVLVPVAAAAEAGPTASLTAEPVAVRFGDALLLRAEVRVPGGKAAVVLVDPSPLSALAPARTSRHTDGAVTVVTVTQRVACLSAACLSSGRAKAVAAGVASVRLGGRTVAVAAERARVTVRGRVDPGLARRPSGGYRVDTSLPAVTYPIAPATLVALLLAGAALAALVALALLVPDARRRLAGRVADVDVDPFARALRLLRESAGRAAPDRRRAADLVARVVRARGGERQVEDASRLAWSRPTPAPADALGLADAVERDRRGPAA